MKRFLSLFVLTTVVLSLSSCSLDRSWGSLSASKLKVLENYRYETGGATFRVRKYLVNENPRETITEVVQVTEGWADR